MVFRYVEAAGASRPALTSSRNSIFDSVPSKVVSAITGGTGRYQNVHGQVVGKQGPDGLVDVVIHIRTS
ncbi:MAG TPA: hypothetical protein VH459_04575 [Gaiellales bacterium]|jgi:hypothetical protein